jgi:tRNA nucleotidyltransferase (CCA-adding enzyme)
VEIALSHSNMDFDSLSAQYALTRLYPSCRMVLGYPLTGNVRSFMSLNRSNLPVMQVKLIDPAKVSRFFMVDCQSFTRLDDSCRKLMDPDYDSESGKPPHFVKPVTVFDHHAVDDAGLMSIATPDSLIERVGACTTLLVERIRREKIELTSFDATVLAIGIFEDTGCLTYSGTTARDADVVAYLISRGADLAVVREYIRPRMEPEQVQLFEVLLQRAMTMNVDGQRYVLTSFQMPHYVEGLATITRQLMEVETCDGAFTIVKMRDRVHIVGRCDSKALSCRDIVRVFGGDGHPGAASAVVKGGDESEILGQIVELIRQHSAPQPVASDIMVSPVRTIRPDISMDEAGRIMVRYGLDGLVVSDGSELLGIVSRRDIDQSSHHKLGHAKVSGFMSKPVIAVEENTTLNEIQNLMIVEDIGRLPVLDAHGSLVGLVSRDDVLKCLFGVNYSRANNLDVEPVERVAPPSSGLNLADKLKEMDEETFALFQIIGDAASSLNMVAYAVGGLVRDLLLGQPNFDLDFVIEGAAGELAEKLCRDFGEKFELLATHERFQTATLKVRGDLEREIDLSTARTEFYEFPAALPEVEPSKLEQDLLRRDFTINALAVCINPERFGDLIDLFAGLRDLEKKVIRILHPFSFIEDPTRIVRAARFAGRFGFHFDTRTREQARRAVAMGIFDDLGGVRIKAELKMILEAPQRIKTLTLLSDLGGNLCYLDKQLDFCDSVKRSMRRCERLLSRFAVLEPWIVYLGALLSELSVDRVRGVLDRLMLTNKQKENIESGLDLHRQMPLSMKELKRSEVYEMMLGRSRESLAIAAAIAQVGSDLRRGLKLYIEELADTKIAINGGDLLALGYEPGPKIGETLSAVLAARLDKEVASREEELALAQRLLG